VGLLNLEVKPEKIQDEILFWYFVLAVGAFLYVRLPITLDNIDVYKLIHPPQAARMNHVMHFATTWAQQDREHLVAWMELNRFQMLMRAVATVIHVARGGGNWSEQTAFLQLKRARSTGRSSTNVSKLT
jgi:hypothetical protein